MTHTEEPVEPVVALTRAAVVRLIRDLRYSASVATPLPVDTGQSEAEYLHGLRHWLGEYSGRLEVAVDTTTEMARELNELRTQRTAIRAFLGLPPSGDT